MIHEKIQLKSNREDVTLTTYFLDDSQETIKGGHRPVVLICPGGAYLNCSDREGEPVALRFNAMGYHAAVLRYSVINQNIWPIVDHPEKMADVNFDSDNHYPEPIRDIARALLWMEDHSKDYKINMDQVILCGFSAGGHNVLNYSTHWHKPVVTEQFDSKALKPAAVIAGYPLSDYVYMNDAATIYGNHELFVASNRSFLGTETPTVEQLEEVSPARQVGDNTPPMFLWTTCGDGLVDPHHTLLMAEGLSKKGIPYELHVYEQGDHGLSLATQSTAMAKTQIKADVSGWIEAAERWLLARFTLPMAEKAPWE